MAFDATTTPALNDATKLNDYIRLRDNDRIGAMPAMAGATLLQGGSHDAFIYSTAFQRLPNCPAFEIDAALGAYVSVYLEVEPVREPGVGVTVNAIFDVWNVTTGAVVTGSEVTVPIDVAHPASKHSKSTAFTLASGVNRYYIRVKTGTADQSVGGFARIVAKGA
jgi:hypothetical protein